jgi:actin related protein 2/3 complex subunit 2
MSTEGGVKREAAGVGTNVGILLEPGNRIVEETVLGQIKREVTSEDEKATPIDVRLCDFDDASYRISSDKENMNLVTVSLSLPSFTATKSMGSQAAFDSRYKEWAIEPESGFDVSLRIDVTKVAKAEELAKQVALLKSNVGGGVYDYFFSAVAKGTIEKEKPFTFNQRGDTIVYFVPNSGGVSVIFSVDFKEKVDRAVARVFLQEFVDARRSLGAAPPVAWGTNPPLELKAFGITEPTGNLGFITFSILKNHVDSPAKKDKCVANIQMFRTYLQYHIKSSKSFFHSRMRFRAAELLKVLNRAKYDPPADREKKTITGRTFTRAI